jgi:hypothetical protein
VGTAEPEGRAMSGRQDDTRDHPLSCHWRPIDADAFETLGLAPAKSRAAAITRAQIIAEAFVVGRADPAAWISYSRRRAFYAGRPRYWPPTYTYDNVVYVVDQLAAAGLLEHEKAAPGQLGWQSRFKATSELVSELTRRVRGILHACRVAMDTLRKLQAARTGAQRLSRIGGSVPASH